jgi:hypothetical protein
MPLPGNALGLLRRALFSAALIILMPMALAQDRPPGPHPGAGLPPLAVVLLDDAVHASLALDATQESTWAALDALDADVHAQQQASRESMRILVATELSKASPDLSLIETTQAYARQTTAAAMLSLSVQASTLYASFGEAQKATVIAAMQAAYQRSLSAPPRR